jgi:hypothetical protein
MGLVSARSYAGRALVSTKTRPAERAKQEIDDGRRAKGYIFGAFCPATGEAFTHPYPGRGGAHWVDFLEHVETWIPRTTERIYAIMDNLSSHRTTDVLLFVLAHPRWEMVFQPKWCIRHVQGQAPPPSSPPLTRDRPPAKGRMTYRMHH